MGELETIKKSLIAEIERRIEDKIIENTNAQLIIKLINSAESINEAIMIGELGTTYKRTGLHFDKRFEKLTNTIKYLKKNDEFSFEDSTTNLKHKLIIGDNYDSLLNLMINYKGLIDIIYIDPPYGKDDLGEFAKTNYENAISRDNLLSMLYPRLVLAKQLLNEDGIIYCSIDDKNQAYIKCLFDEIFGEQNFISCICREAIKGGSQSNNIKKVHDYILVYAKELNENGKQKVLLCGDEFTEENNYIYEDEKGKYAKGRELNKWGAGSRREDSPSMWFPIIAPDGTEVYPIRNDGSEGRWRWGKNKLLKAVENNDVLFEKRSDGSYIAYEKIRNDKVKNKQLISILKDDYINANGSDELKKIFNTLMSPFDYAKPVKLIKELVKYYPTDNCKILDFFAGSGTTGQAILELNLEDDGNREFILCTANEKSDSTPNGIVYDVTLKRLKRIMTGFCYDGTNDFDWLKEHEPYGNSLNVYEIASVANFERTTGKTPFDVIDEAAYDITKFKNIKDKIEWICSNFEITEKDIESDNEWKNRMEEK